MEHIRDRSRLDFKGQTLRRRQPGTFPFQHPQYQDDHGVWHDMPAPDTMLYWLAHKLFAARKFTAEFLDEFGLPVKLSRSTTHELIEAACNLSPLRGWCELSSDRDVDAHYNGRAVMALWNPYNMIFKANYHLHGDELSFTPKED